MRSGPVIILFCFICCSLAHFEPVRSAEGYPAVSALVLPPGYANLPGYTSAMNESRAGYDRPGSLVPIYLGSTSVREPARLGGRISPYADLRGARWSPTWPYNQTLTQKNRFIPASQPVGIEEYHVPSIVEFLKPDWNPAGFNYSYYVPSLGEFANTSWTPQQANYSLHVPALGEFLREKWQPQGPNPADYPLWMTEYLRG